MSSNSIDHFAWQTDRSCHGRVSSIWLQKTGGQNRAKHQWVGQGASLLDKRKNSLLPSGKRLQKTMENHHFSWENPLFQWSFSIAMLNYQRVTIIVLMNNVHILRKTWKTMFLSRKSNGCLNNGVKFLVPHNPVDFRTFLRIFQGHLSMGPTINWTNRPSREPHSWARVCRNCSPRT